MEPASINAHMLTLIPPSGISRVVVEEDNGVPGLWYVRLIKGGRRSLQPPIYFPGVTTQEALLNALDHAWDLQRKPYPPFPFFTRFLEPPRTPPRGASPPRRQRGVSPQTGPRLV